MSTERERVRLVLTPAPDPAPLAVRVRHLLKFAWRNLKMRAVEVVLPDDPPGKAPACAQDRPGVAG